MSIYTQLPTKEALDTIDAVIESCEDTLTKLQQLERWAE